MTHREDTTPPKGNRPFPITVEPEGLSHDIVIVKFPGGRFRVCCHGAHALAQDLIGVANQGYCDGGRHGDESTMYCGRPPLIDPGEHKTRLEQLKDANAALTTDLHVLHTLLMAEAANEQRDGADQRALRDAVMPLLLAAKAIRNGHYTTKSTLKAEDRRLFDTFELAFDVLNGLKIADPAPSPAPAVPVPVAMYLNCPLCGARHIDLGEFATKPHHTHACQGCGLAWRPAIVHTVGVEYLPGFKNEVK